VLGLIVQTRGVNKVFQKCFLVIFDLVFLSFFEFYLNKGVNMSDNKDELSVVRSAIISKAFSDRYLNVNRMLRDLGNVEDSYAKLDTKSSIGEQLNGLLNKVGNDSEKTNNVLQKVMVRLDQLEDRGQ